MTRILLWSLRRDEHSGVLIGAGGTRRSDWPARVLTNDESVDSPLAKSDQLHVCRDKWQLAATGSRHALIAVAHFFNWSPIRLRYVRSDVGRRRSLIS